MRTHANAHRIDRNDPRYPQSVAALLDDDSPAVLNLLGEPQVLQRVQLGLICSVSCPGSVVIKTYDAIRELRDAGVVVAGGFHSPMERECLDFLLRGAQPVSLCPACGLASFSLDPQQQEAVERARLLVVSIFGPDDTPATTALALRRNKFVAALAGAVFVPHAAPGGKAEATARHAIGWRRKVLTFDDEQNTHLVELGVKPASVRELVHWASGLPKWSSNGQP
jgi:predicted Rossmann fold nucleotide-binding protein DprA/Smf involved in DNA uptake